MQYLLMTGATGLLGEYLLRDLSLAGIRLAVLARSSRDGSAVERIERIFARWERATGSLLPRPIVMEGDITREHLGTSESDRRWIARNVGSFLNNAASLTFEGDRADGEPWRSNLDGTKNAIALCHELGIRKFHQVSTSYVSGLRSGTIFESQLDEGQSFANEYEASKCAAEMEVRAAGFETLTVFRPAIIVGDSTTGYTSTYHGFYAPLKAMHSLLSLPAHVEGTGSEPVPIEPMLAALGLTGDETKNFVPVDWVSNCISDVVRDASLHGLTYHLTPSTRVSAREVAEAMQAALVADARNRPQRRNSVAREVTPTNHRSGQSFLSELGGLLAQQVSVYQEYWRDDPVFDATTTSTKLPRLPCPVLTPNVLRMLCDYAVQKGFGWPRPPLERVSPSLASKFAAKVSRLACVDRPLVALEMFGPGGGSVTFGYEGETFGFQEGWTDEVSGWAFQASIFEQLGSFARIVESGLGLYRSPSHMVADGAGTKLDRENAKRRLFELDKVLELPQTDAHAMVVSGS